MLERLKVVKENLMSALQTQMGNLQNADTKELGEVVDMIKDLEEAIYYCTITKAMEEQGKEEKSRGKEIERHYYTERPYYPPMYYGGGAGQTGQGGNGNNMYYSGRSDGSNSGSSSSNGGGASRNMYYTEVNTTDGRDASRDSREGRSGSSRRTYIEAKDLKKGQAMQIKELEHYVQELSNDLVEMIGDASPEEKNILKQHLKTISEKIK